jgi:hypothetical protein
MPVYTLYNTDTNDQEASATLTSADDALTLAQQVEAQLATDCVDPATIRRLIAAVRRERGSAQWRQRAQLHDIDHQRAWVNRCVETTYLQ